MRKIVFDIETKDAAITGKLDPLKLEIALVCIHDSEHDAYDCFFEEDLPKLWPILERTDLLIGYNSDHFDIPLLNKYYPGDLTAIKSLDLLKEIKQVLGRRLRLDSVAEATLGTKKIGNGLQAIEWWQRGEFDKVREYCLMDVRITKEIYDHARKHGFIKYKDFGATKEIKLDTSGWETKEDSSMTHTLPF